jgi:hypothetical protein
MTTKVEMLTIDDSFTVRAGENNKVNRCITMPVAAGDHWHDP